MSPLQPLVVLGLASIALVLTKRGRRLRGTVLVLLGLTVFLITPISYPVWEHTPVLGKIQFPWRFVTFYEIAIALALPLLWDTVRKSGRRWPGKAVRGALVVPTVVAVIAPVANPWLHPPTTSLSEWVVDTSAGAPEWLGATENGSAAATAAAIFSFQPPPPFSVNQGAAELLEEAPRSLKVHANCPRGCRIVLARGYWRFWQITEAKGATATLGSTDGVPLLTLNVAPGGGNYRIALVQPNQV